MQHDNDSVAEAAADALARIEAEFNCEGGVGGGGFTAYYREDSAHCAEADVWAVLRHYGRLLRAVWAADRERRRKLIHGDAT